MKKLILIALVAFTINTRAQVSTPQSSPKASIEQIVGLTQVDVEYARPAKRGRLVFGDLVAYGKLWRTGANENTKITFSDDVKIGGKKLSKGTYALFSIPKADAWEILFYTDTSNWGLPQNWDENKVALAASVTPEKLNKNVEYFTIAVQPVDANQGELVLQWEDTSVNLRFEVPTHEKAMSSIQTALGPNATQRDYYSAAQYLFASDGDMNQALEYINKSLELGKDQPFFILRQKALIQAKAGDKAGAIATANQSMEAAQKVGNEEYVRMNKASIQEWSR